MFIDKYCIKFRFLGKQFEDFVILILPVRVRPVLAVVLA